MLSNTPSPVRKANRKKARAAVAVTVRKSSKIIILYYGKTGIHQTVSSAIETGWGESTLAKEHHNFFGITAYGRPNAFWKGTKTDLSENSGHTSLWFRTYESAEDSFMAFARLIHTGYPVAASLSAHPSAYAKEIAYSKYISEVNGDNRAAYQRMLVSICRAIERLITNS